MPTRDEIAGAILSAIRESLQTKGIHDVNPTQDTPVDRSLGLDSLDWAAVVVRLESELGIDPFEQGVEGELRAVRDLVSLYDAALRQGA
jgi:acyl carrier protein